MEVVQALSRFPAGARMPLADAVREAQPVLLENLDQRESRYPDFARLTGGRVEAALIALPLILRGKAIGGISLGFPTQRAFNEQDRAFLLTVAGLCAQAFDRARLYDAERAARERAEEQFARFMQHLPGLAWIKDADGRYVYANDAAVNAFGKSRAELHGKTDEEIFPPATAAQFRENDRKVLAGGTGVRVVETLEQGDGVLHVSVVSKFPMPGRDGSAALVGGMAIDITQEAHAARRDSEERLRTLSDNLPLGAVYQGVLDRQGRRQCTYISAGVERLFGVTPAEAMADATVLYRLVHEDDQARLAAQDESSLRDLTPLDCEFRSWTRSGKLIWVHVRSASRRLANGETIWEGIILDVTPRKRAEEELARVTAESEKRRRLYEAALSNTPDLVYVFDLNHRFTYANEGLLKMWGRTWDEAIGKTCLELGYEPWHAAMHDREIEQAVAARETIQGEVPFTGAFGPRVYEYIFVPVLGENGEVEAVAGTTRDVTERKRAEEALRETDRRKDEFLATLAHELRNPLAPIRNSLEILKAPRVDEATVRKTREMMERQVIHLVRLVDDLLDVSRVMRGKVELRRERVELATVVARAVETAQPLIDVQGHELHLSLPSESLLVDGDPLRLAQVVGNLLANSAKYTDANGRIWLTVRRHGDEAVLSVRDTGIGIAPDLLPHVFELFVQGHHSSMAQGGLGIGLTLVRNLMEMHGGTVEAHSDGPGKGSEFVIRLPLSILRQELSSESRGAGLSTSLSSEPGRRLLVVDDNRDAADSLAVLLRMQGYEVRVAHDGIAALETVNVYRPAMVFLDIGMPKMDGFEVARRLRQRHGPEELQLVALTGWGQKEDRRRTTEAGFDHHLVKPVELEAIEELLNGLK